MTNLSTLYLLIDAEDADPRVDDCVLREEIIPSGPDELPVVNHLKDLQLRVSNSNSLIFLRRVMRFWGSISNLSVSIPYGEMLMYDVIFHNFLAMASSTVNLQELKLYVPPLSLLVDPASSMIDRLRTIKTLVLPAVQFGTLAFESLVQSTPRVEVFKIGDSSDFYSFNEQNAYKNVSGLGLIDLSSLTLWKCLRECVLFWKWTITPWKACPLSRIILRVYIGNLPKHSSF